MELLPFDIKDLIAKNLDRVDRIKLGLFDRECVDIYREMSRREAQEIFRYTNFMKRKVDRESTKNIIVYSDISMPNGETAIENLMMNSKSFIEKIGEGRDVHVYFDNLIDNINDLSDPNQTSKEFFRLYSYCSNLYSFDSELSMPAISKGIHVCFGEIMKSTKRQRNGLIFNRSGHYGEFCSAIEKYDNSRFFEKRIVSISIDIGDIYSAFSQNILPLREIERFCSKFTSLEKIEFEIQSVWDWNWGTYTVGSEYGNGILVVLERILSILVENNRNIKIIRSVENYSFKHIRGNLSVVRKSNRDRFFGTFLGEDGRNRIEECLSRCKSLMYTDFVTSRFHPMATFGGPLTIPFESITEQTDRKYIDMVSSDRFINTKRLNIVKNRMNRSPGEASLLFLKEMKNLVELYIVVKIYANNFSSSSPSETTQRLEDPVYLSGCKNLRRFHTSIPINICYLSNLTELESISPTSFIDGMNTRSKTLPTGTRVKSSLLLKKWRYFFPNIPDQKTPLDFCRRVDEERRKELDGITIYPFPRSRMVKMREVHLQRLSKLKEIPIISSMFDLRYLKFTQVRNLSIKFPQTFGDTDIETKICTTRSTVNRKKFHSELFIIDGLDLDSLSVIISLGVMDIYLINIIDVLAINNEKLVHKPTLDVMKKLTKFRFEMPGIGDVRFHVGGWDLWFYFNDIVHFHRLKNLVSLQISAYVNIRKTRFQKLKHLKDLSLISDRKNIDVLLQKVRRMPLRNLHVSLVYRDWLFSMNGLDFVDLPNVPFHINCGLLSSMKDLVNFTIDDRECYSNSSRLMSHDGSSIYFNSCEETNKYKCHYPLPQKLIDVRKLRKLRKLQVLDVYADPIIDWLDKRGNKNGGGALPTFRSMKFLRFGHLMIVDIRPAFYDQSSSRNYNTLVFEKLIENLALFIEEEIYDVDEVIFRVYYVERPTYPNQCMFYRGEIPQETSIYEKLSDEVSDQQRDMYTFSNPTYINELVSVYESTLEKNREKIMKLVKQRSIGRLSIQARICHDRPGTLDYGEISECYQ